MGVHFSFAPGKYEHFVSTARPPSLSPLALVSCPVPVLDAGIERKMISFAVSNDFFVFICSETASSVSNYLDILTQLQRVANNFAYAWELSVSIPLSMFSERACVVVCA